MASADIVIAGRAPIAVVCAGLSANRLHRVASLDATSNTPSDLRGRAALGVEELSVGARNWRMWHLMGSSDIRRRYSRSRLGQFWVTLSSGISIAIIAVMWSLLWKVTLAEMLPYLAVSMTVWQFISGIVGDATQVFISNAHGLLSHRIACSTMLYAMVYRNLLLLAHNFVIIALVFVVFQVPVGWQVVLVVPGLALTALTGIWLGYLIGCVCARFRDVVPAVQAALQLAFYVTPVIWRPDFLAAEWRWLEVVNPFAIFMNIIRGPLLGEPVVLVWWLLAACIALGGLCLSLSPIGRYRRQLLFWL